MTSVPAPAAPTASPRRLVRARAWATAWIEAYVPLLRRRRPRTGIELGTWLPGWVLRLVSAAAILGLASAAGAVSVAWVILIGIAGWMVARPSGVAGGAAVIAVALLLALRPEPVTPLVLAIVLVVLTASVQLAALLGGTGIFARIELPVLAAPLPRFLAVQALVQPLALVGGWLAGQDVLAGPGWVVLPLLAVLGLGVLSFVWIPRLRAQADAGPTLEP